jgi:hypothetical protein
MRRPAGACPSWPSNTRPERTDRVGLRGEGCRGRSDGQRRDPPEPLKRFSHELIAIRSLRRAGSPRSRAADDPRDRIELGPGAFGEQPDDRQVRDCVRSGEERGVPSSGPLAPGACGEPTSRRHDVSMTVRRLPERQARHVRRVDLPAPLASEHKRTRTDAKIERSHDSMSLFVWYFGTKRQWHDALHHTMVLGPRHDGLLGAVGMRACSDPRGLPDPLPLSRGFARGLPGRWTSWPRSRWLTSMPGDASTRAPRAATRRRRRNCSTSGTERNEASDGRAVDRHRPSATSARIRTRGRRLERLAESMRSPRARARRRRHCECPP